MTESPEEFLAHFGVKGMKWGVIRDRNSGGDVSGGATQVSVPKKPKEASSETVAKREKRATAREQKNVKIQEHIDHLKKQKYRTSYESRERDNTVAMLERMKTTNVKNAQRIRDGKMTSGQKKLLIGAGVAAGLMLAYGGYKLQDSGEFRAAVIRGRELLGGKEFSWKSKSDLSGPLSADGLMQKVIPQINPGFGKYGTKMNCRRATFAYEMRRRGFDVQATLSNAATGQTQAGLFNAIDQSSELPTRGLKMYKTVISEAMAKDSNPNALTPYTDILTKGWGKNPIDMGSYVSAVTGKTNLASPDRRAEAIFNAIAKQPERSRGELAVKWLMGGGHSMAYEVINGKTHIIDGQSGEIFKTPEAFKKFAATVTEAGFTRLDNVDLNEQFLTRWVTNVA